MNQDLLNQINRVNCGGAGVLGTGTNNCPFNRKRVVAAMFTRAGFEFEEELTIAYIHELQQRGIAVVVSKMVGFADQTAEDSINTYESSRIKTKNGTSPYEYLATFNNGIYNHKALTTLESFGNYDVTYVDEKLNILFTSNGEYVKGFSCGQIAAMPYVGENGNNPAEAKIWWQELYRSEFDQDAAWITADNHDIRLSQLDGVNDAIVQITAIPVNGAESVTFRVKTKADTKDVDLGGLLPANIQLQKNGAAITVATVTQNAETKVYTASFTGALATGEVITLRLNDALFSTGIIKKGGRLYRSNKDSKTVIAS